MFGLQTIVYYIIIHFAKYKILVYYFDIHIRPILIRHLIRIHIRVTSALYSYSMISVFVFKI
jgi:hypothetical protein